MQKSKLDKFISKYNLGGNVNSVKWKASGDSISTSFKAPLPLIKVLIKLLSNFICVPNSGNLLSAGGSAITDKSLNT